MKGGRESVKGIKQEATGLPPPILHRPIFERKGYE